MEPSPLEQYGPLQPLVKKDITDAILNLQKKQQYTVVKIPGHVHNGSDAPPVVFSTLTNANQHSVVARITLTPTQVKALFTTPVVLVPQPGPLTVVIVDSVTVRLTYSGTAYTGTHNLEFHYTDGNGAQVTDAVPAAFINSTASVYYHAPAVSGSFVPIAGGSGSNGQIVAFVNTANPATGNSQITIVTKYRLVPFAF